MKYPETDTNRQQELITNSGRVNYYRNGDFYLVDEEPATGSELVCVCMEGTDSDSDKE